MARGFMDEDRESDDAWAGSNKTSTAYQGYGERYVELAAKILPGVTGKARRFDCGTKQLFIPFSQMKFETREAVKSLDAGAAVTISITEWFASKEGLI